MQLPTPLGGWESVSVPDQGEAGEFVNNLSIARKRRESLDHNHTETGPSNEKYAHTAC